MSGGEDLEWYASQSALTDPGRLAWLLDDLPSGIDELQAVAHGLVVPLASRPATASATVRSPGMTSTRGAEFPWG